MVLHENHVIIKRYLIYWETTVIPNVVWEGMDARCNDKLHEFATEPLKIILKEIRYIILHHNFAQSVITK